MIPAIVLTYDRYRCVAENMITCYEDLWPKHPFLFHIPFQVKPLKAIYGTSQIVPVCSPPDILSTLNSLLEPFDGNEWIFWCMDDRFPLELNSFELDQIARWIISKDPPLDGLAFTRSPRDWSQRNCFLWKWRLRGPGGRIFLRKKHYGSIWSHQFLRVKVLRRLFSGFPSRLARAKDMDEHLFRSKLPPEFRLYVVQRSLALYAESASRGALTESCVRSMQQHGISVPEDFRRVPERIIINGDARPRFPNLVRRLRDLPAVFLNH